MHKGWEQMVQGINSIVTLAIKVAPQVPNMLAQLSSPTVSRLQV